MARGTRGATVRGDLAAETGFAVRHAAPVLAIAALAACAESTTGPSAPASLRILSSRAPSDTIDVAFAEQFSAQVLDASGRPVPQALIRDRKSTRLNSSH